MLGNAEHVVDPASPNEERVGEAIEIAQRCRRLGFAVFGEPDDETFGAPADGAGHMQVGAGKRSSGVNEVCQRRKVVFGSVNGPFERLRIGLADAQSVLPTLGQRCGEIAAEIEERVLRPRQPFV